MADLDKTLEDFKANAEEIKNHCNTITPEQCMNGECEFYDKNTGECKFDSMTMCSPWEWTI